MNEASLGRPEKFILFKRIFMCLEARTSNTGDQFKTKSLARRSSPGILEAQANETERAWRSDLTDDESVLFPQRIREEYPEEYSKSRPWQC